VEQEDVHRLSKLCGMLGSAHDGERSSAALMASKFLKTHDLTWHDVVMKAFFAPVRTDAPHWSAEPKTEIEWAICIRARCWDQLNSWERDFLTSIIDRNRWPLSVKQRAILDKLRNNQSM